MRDCGSILLVAFSIAVAMPIFVCGTRQVKFINKCGKDIWISPLTHPFGTLPTPESTKLGQGEYFSYEIPDEGWAGRFWPRIGCDEKGDNCQAGSSIPFCSTEGCDPPANTKVSFYFPRIKNEEDVKYYLNVMEGYSISTEVVPSKTSNTCKKARCAVSLDACPKAEDTLGDLRVIKNGSTVMCLAPITKWSYSFPFGYAQKIDEGDGKWYSCLPKSVLPEQCRSKMAKSEYVKLIHKDCPTGFPYSLDDEGQLYSCPNDVNFEVNFCV